MQVLWKEDDDLDWTLLKPDIFAAIMDFYASGQELLSADSAETEPAIEEHETSESSINIINSNPAKLIFMP